MAWEPDVTVPHSARIWNYWLGGTDNYAVDREAGDAYAATFPGVFELARQSRRFLVRAVRWLAAEGEVRQFLDIGAGLPFLQNTHEVAADAGVVYVDNDPEVIAQGRAAVSRARYVEADLRDPDRVVGLAGEVLDLTRPVAVMFMGVLGHVTDDDEMHSIVARTMAAVPSGSYLVLYDGADTSEEAVTAADDYKDTGAVPYVNRSLRQIARCFEGLELLPPGLVPISLWRPDPTDGDAEPVDAYGAVARKP